MRTLEKGDRGRVSAEIRRGLAGAALGWWVTLSGCASVPEGIQACSLAIEHVSVVPMDSERVLADHTVRVDGDRIVSISPETAAGPRCANVIDGGGRYLLPGLNDMHIHLESRMFPEAFQAPDVAISYEDVLLPYLAHGVTGVRVMSGAPDILAFRDVPHGPAPRMLIASPMLSGEPPIIPEPIAHVLETPEEAVEAVNAFVDAGYDFIKIRENLEPDVLKAVVGAANQRHVDVDGHLANAGDPLASGQRGIAHVDLLSLMVDDPSADAPDIVRRLLACNCYVTTTLVVEQNVAAQLRDYEAMAARLEMRYVHPMLRRLLWDRERNPYLAEGQDPAFFDGLLETDQLLVRVLNEQGVPLLAGTDALIPMIIPGYSLHDELTLLVEAGLSPYDALRTATRTPAEIFARFGDLGVIAPGKAANLVLVSGNPLDDIAVLRRPDAVIIEGVYLDRASIERRLEEIALRFAEP